LQSPRFAPGLIRSLHGPGRPQEHTATPQYPPIKEKKKFEDPVEFMKNLKTVEEKQYQINRPKYYGWYSHILSQDWVPHSGLDFLQFATQTHIVPTGKTPLDGESGESSPGQVAADDEKVGRIVDEVAPLVEQTLLDLVAHTQHGFEVENDKLAFREKGGVHWEGGFAFIRERERQKAVIKALHQVLSRHLAPSNPHLVDSSEDFNARNEAFWFRGGIGPDKSMIKKREGRKKFEEKEFRDKGITGKVWRADGLKECKVDKDGKWKHENAVDEDGNLQHPLPYNTELGVMEPYERALQYKGENVVQVRCRHPIPPWVEHNHTLVTDTELPTTAEGATVGAHDPREWGYKGTCQHATTIPGYWPDEDRQHGLLLIHHRVNNHMKQMVASKGWKEENLAQLEHDGNKARALLSCFGWLYAQASHLGFTPMTELTYPLATQACFTDGRIFTNYWYQLNSCDLRHHNTDPDTKNNVLWVGDDKVLYDKVEDGKLVNFDPSALAPLISQYLTQPKPRENMTPYLGEVGRVSEHPDNYQRRYFKSLHRHQYTNRPRHFEKPETYLWEKIHLIDHPAMFAKQVGLRRRRWFQMYKVDQHGRQHWHPEFKQYDEERHRYVPKAYREPWQRKYGMGRRYSKNAPKVTVPLQDKVSEFQMPDTRYNKKKPLIGYAWKTNKDQGPGFN